MRNLGTFFIGLVVVLFLFRTGLWPCILLIAFSALGFSLMKKPANNNSDGPKASQPNNPPRTAKFSPALPDYYETQQYAGRPASLSKKLKGRIKRPSTT